MNCCAPHTPIGLFTLAAIKKVSTLRDKVESTKAKFAKQDMQPHVLFNIIVTFVKDFEKAKEQVYASTKGENTGRSQSTSFK